MQLRQYQQEAIDAILLTTEHGVIKLPTGSGKTVIFTELIHQNENKNFLILTDRRILIEQTLKYLNTPNYSLVTRQKLGRFNDMALKNYLSRYKYVLIDECHGVNLDDGTYKKVFSFLAKQTLVIGFTATPYRLDNGVIYGEDKLFKRLIYSMSYEELKEKNYLVDIEYWTNPRLAKKFKQLRATKGTDNKFTKETTKEAHIQAVKELIVKYSIDKAVIYCISIEHANFLGNILDLPFKYYHSKMSHQELDDNLSWFKSMDKGFILNINMLTTGFDYPALRNIIVARPTQSKSLWNQMLGRLTRISEGKTHGTVYDMVGNAITHGILDAVNGSVGKGHRIVLDEDERIEVIRTDNTRKELVEYDTKTELEKLLKDGEKIVVKAVINQVFIKNSLKSNAPTLNIILVSNYLNTRKNLTIWIPEKENLYARAKIKKLLGIDNFEWDLQRFMQDITILKDNKAMFQVEIEKFSDYHHKINKVIKAIEPTTERLGKLKEIKELEEQIEQLGYACNEGQDYEACEEMEILQDRRNKIENSL